jgi:uncharacterized protein with HEPN domain
MARRNPLVVLLDILGAIDGIERAATGRALDDLSRDWLLKHGIERGLEIVSEASRHLPEELIAKAPEVPWKKIRGLGNILRHEYHDIQDRIIWVVVQDELPPLRAAIVRLQGTLEDEQ